LKDIRLLAAIAACCASGIGSAAFIESAPTTVRSLGDPLLFDFSASGLTRPAGADVGGLDFVWKAVPGPGAAAAHLTAGVALPNFELGTRFEAALEATVPAGGAPLTTAPATFVSDDSSAPGLGLPEEFLAGDSAVLEAVLFTSGVGAQDLETFFAEGGSLEATMRVEVAGVDAPPAGPQGSVPEPASVALWACVAALAVAGRRRANARAA
jgi:hypothetical protein